MSRIRELVVRILEINYISLRGDRLKFPLKCKTAAVSAAHPFSDLKILKRAAQCKRGAQWYLLKRVKIDRLLYCKSTTPIVSYNIYTLRINYHLERYSGVRRRSIGHGNDDATEFQCQDDHNVNTVCVGLSSLYTQHRKNRHGSSVIRPVK